MQRLSLSLIKEAGLLLRAFFLFLIKLWRALLAPCFGNRCQFNPSCSEYALGVLERFGLLRGSYLAAHRICRCNSLFKGGEDPVPKM